MRPSLFPGCVVAKGTLVVVLVALSLWVGESVLAREGQPSSFHVPRMTTAAEQEDFRFSQMEERLRNFEVRLDRLAFQVKRLHDRVHQDVERSWEQDASGFSAGEKSEARGMVVPDGEVQADSAYESAYEFILLGDAQSAEEAFTAFLQAYPSHDLSGRARYWLGESYFLQDKFRSSASLFMALHQRGDIVHERGADVLLRLATSLARLGETGSACFYFSELALKFPGASYWVKQEAARESGRIGC